jgi:hypothetical protein
MGMLWFSYMTEDMHYDPYGPDSNWLKRSAFRDLTVPLEAGELIAHTQTKSPESSTALFLAIHNGLVWAADPVNQKNDCFTVVIVFTDGINAFDNAPYDNTTAVLEEIRLCARDAGGNSKPFVIYTIGYGTTDVNFSVLKELVGSSSTENTPVQTTGEYGVFYPAQSTSIQDVFNNIKTRMGMQ